MPLRIISKIKYFTNKYKNIEALQAEKNVHNLIKK